MTRVVIMFLALKAKQKENKKISKQSAKLRDISHVLHRLSVLIAVTYFCPFLVFIAIHTLGN